MSSSTSRTPASVVGTTVELIEPILLHLDMRSLLTSALRVCRQWRDLIQGSKSLQRALFFESDEDLAETMHQITFNPLLVELFPTLFDFNSSPETRGFNDLAIEALPIGQSRVPFYRRNASWRRMHLRQPPVRDLGFWTLDAIHYRREELYVARYGRGLRMEGFYFLVLRHVYWWDVSVSWGEAQGRQLRNWQYARREGKRAGEKMVRTTDVIIGAIADRDCRYEDSNGGSVNFGARIKLEEYYTLADYGRIGVEKVRKDVISNGLVKMGIFWFKVMEADDPQVLWREWDNAGVQNCRCGWCCTKRSSQLCRIWS